MARDTTEPAVNMRILNEMNAAEVARLWSLWRKFDVYLACLNSIVAVLEEKPDIRRYFVHGNDELQGLNTDLSSESRVIAHSRMIAGFLTMVVNQLHDYAWDKNGLSGDRDARPDCDEALRSAGSTHFLKGITFTAENYLVFKRKFSQNISDQLDIASRNLLSPTVSRKRDGSRSPLLAFVRKYSPLMPRKLRPLARSGKCISDTMLKKSEERSKCGELRSCGSELFPVGDAAIIEKFLTLIIRRLKDGFLKEAMKKSVDSASLASKLSSPSLCSQVSQNSPYKNKLNFRSCHQNSQDSRHSSNNSQNSPKFLHINNRISQNSQHKCSQDSHSLTRNSQCSQNSTQNSLDCQSSTQNSQDSQSSTQNSLDSQSSTQNSQDTQISTENSQDSPNCLHKNFQDFRWNSQDYQNTVSPKKSLSSISSKLLTVIARV